MKYHFLILLLLVAFTEGKSMENQGSVKEVGLIPGKYFHEAQLAYNEFSKHRLNSRNYEILLFESGESLIVLFKPLSIPTGMRGSIQGTPNFEVEVNINNSTIMRSNFVR